MIPNGEINQAVLTDDAKIAELKELEELLSEAFCRPQQSISWVYTVYDLLVRYKCLTGREYEIETEDTIV